VLGLAYQIFGKKIDIIDKLFLILNYTNYIFAFFFVPLTLRAANELHSPASAFVFEPILWAFFDRSPKSKPISIERHESAVILRNYGMSLAILVFSILMAHRPHGNDLLSYIYTISGFIGVAIILILTLDSAVRILSIFDIIKEQHLLDAESGATLDRSRTGAVEIDVASRSIGETAMIDSKADKVIKAKLRQFNRGIDAHLASLTPEQLEFLRDTPDEEVGPSGFPTAAYLERERAVLGDKANFPD
jgi:hypothetical protein